MNAATTCTPYLTPAHRIMPPPSAAANSSAIFVFGRPPPGGGARAGWGAGQKASVAPGPAASATISHFPARGGIWFLPKVAFPVHSIPPLSAPVPTVPPAWLLAVCDPLSLTLRLYVQHQLSAAGHGLGGRAEPAKSMRTVMVRPLSGQNSTCPTPSPPETQAF